jgi:pSer/pThr/pTyr-binding forkhead associated (FHA) protein/NADPH-dependent 2,4-dienoyl-CoA reductase/sulfur reductase-like enzyme
LVRNFPFLSSPGGADLSRPDLGSLEDPAHRPGNEQGYDSERHQPQDHVGLHRRLPTMTIWKASVRLRAARIDLEPDAGSAVQAHAPPVGDGIHEEEAPSRGIRESRFRVRGDEARPVVQNLDSDPVGGPSPDKPHLDVPLTGELDAVGHELVHKEPDAVDHFRIHMPPQLLQRSPGMARCPRIGRQIKGYLPFVHAFSVGDHACPLNTQKAGCALKPIDILSPPPLQPRTCVDSPGGARGTKAARGMTEYAIIGDGAAGTTAAFYIRRHDPNGRIRIYSDESTPAYYRAALTNYLMGELRAEQLFAVPPNFYDEFKVDRVLTRVTGLDTNASHIELSDGQRAAYDRLLIAAGSRARTPSFPGAELAGVMTMRTMQDARFIMDQVSSGHLRRAVIVGGGILGLELVAGLRARNIDVTYVIRGSHFMPGVLDRLASDLVIARCRLFGVDVRLEEEIGEAYGDHMGYFQAVRLKNSGETLESQLLAVAIGILPNVEFLEGSGIRVNRGIPVDERMRTNVENVFAGGDIAEVIDPRTNKSKLLGLWEPARHHGRTAGINMTGGGERWRVPTSYNATRLYDLDLAAVGDSVEEEGDEVLLDFPQTGRTISYRKLVLRDDRLVGALLLAERKEKVRQRGQRYRKLIDLGVDVSSIRELLLDPHFDLNTWMSSLQEEAAPPGPGKARPAGKVKADMSRILGREEVAAAMASVGPSVAPAPSAPPAASGRRGLSSLMRTPDIHGRGRSQQSLSQPPAAPVGSGIAEAAVTLRLADGTLHEVGESLTLGRNPDNGLVLNDPQVSGNHAAIRRQADGVLIADVGSRNGTFVNESPVKAPQALQHNDIIRVGNSELTFGLQVMAPRDQTGPAGLPDEPLERPPADTGVTARLTWDGHEFDVSEDVFQIGRDDQDAKVHLDDPAASWLHAEVTRHGDALYLRDLGSRNGTYVNGELVAVPHPLADGDVIHIGGTDLIFHSATRAAAQPVAPRPSSIRSGSGLLGTGGRLLGVWFAIKGGSVTVGRDPSCDVTINDLTVSRRHAELRRDGDQWRITDLGSTNGTEVRGEAVPHGSWVTVAAGDEIKLGNISLTLSDRRSAPSSVREAETMEAAGPSVPSEATAMMEQPERAREPEPAEPEDIEKPEPAVVTALLVVSGPSQGREIPLPDLPLVIGREDSPDTTGLGDGYISTRHLEIDRAPDGSIQATDLGSTNGTWLEDEQLRPNTPVKLVRGAKLRLGPMTTLEAD